jgi:GLPGLI family protein
MLKKAIFITIYFLGINYFYCQNIISDTSKYKISYNLIYQQDSTDIYSKREEQMSLLIGQTYSLFQSENNRFNDSIVKSLSINYKNDAQMAVNIALSSRKKTKIKYKIFKSSKEVIVFDKIYTDKFIYKDEDKLVWNITGETEQINNYLCQKATTFFGGRKYTAWFTNKIPINDGPYKFKGLPGLIIKIYDSKKQYIFEFLRFEKNNTKFSFDRENAQKISKVEFFKAYNDFKNNFINQLEQRGISFDESNASKVRESLKKTRNNEIEIKVQ